MQCDYSNALHPTLKNESLETRAQLMLWVDTEYLHTDGYHLYQLIYENVKKKISYDLIKLHLTDIIKYRLIYQNIIFLNQQISVSDK